MFLFRGRKQSFRTCLKELTKLKFNMLHLNISPLPKKGRGTGFVKKTQTSFSGIVPGELAKQIIWGDKEKLVMGLISRGGGGGKFRYFQTPNQF